MNWQRLFSNTLCGCKYSAHHYERRRLQRLLYTTFNFIVFIFNFAFFRSTFKFCTFDVAVLITCNLKSIFSSKYMSLVKHVCNFIRKQIMLQSV